MVNTRQGEITVMVRQRRAPLPEVTRPRVLPLQNGGIPTDSERMRALLFVAVLFLPPAVFAQSPLYWALANNDALEVWNLAPQAPEVLEENGLSAPAWAVARGNAEAVEVLAWRGVPLDQVDPEGRNLLFGAAALGRLDLFETIAAAGARLDQVDTQGRTLIHAAARSPHPEMLKALLAKGLGALERTTLGITPLMLACGAGRAPDVQLLLAWGAVPEDQDYLGRSVRDYALAGGDASVLALIDEALTPWTIEPADGVLLP